MRAEGQTHSASNPDTENWIREEKEEGEGTVCRPNTIEREFALLGFQKEETFRLP
jgi:hypothetical protein